MGKRLRVQRRGRGSSTFRASTHKRVAPSHYAPMQSNEITVKAKVKGLVHEPGRGAPLSINRLESGREFSIVAPEGIAIDQDIELGSSAELAIGNVLPLGNIPSGVFVCNLELFPGDGGKLVRSSGTSASVVSHTSGGTFVKLPSGKPVCLNDRCLATVGVVSGSGRTDKPFLKAGKKKHWMAAKGKVYPRSSGINMNPVSHPHGGGAHKTQSMKPTTVSRTAPPGQKVGIIAARQTGRGKRRRRS